LLTVFFSITACGPPMKMPYPFVFLIVFLRTIGAAPLT
jgi:hypothetical protein